MTAHDRGCKVKCGGWGSVIARNPLGARGSIEALMGGEVGADVGQGLVKRMKHEKDDSDLEGE